MERRGLREPQHGGRKPGSGRPDPVDWPQACGGPGSAAQGGMGHCGLRPPILGEASFELTAHGNRTLSCRLQDGEHRLGGYQVLKKWLSYRERNVLGRALLPEEVQHFTDTARRIAAILSQGREE